MSKQWPLPEWFSIRLTMESDWHVGSGMGRPGNVDALIVRDADGLPFVPAKTLRGIWRDACERLCRGLDDGHVGKWSKLVDYLFGSQPTLQHRDPSGRHHEPTAQPLGATLEIKSARLSPALRQCLAHQPLLRQALTFIKPGVKIDRRSGSAQTDFLRFEEVVRKGIILEADCHLPLEDETTRKLASALLIASAQLVERLGGKRRRGHGRCRLNITDAAPDEAIAWLNENLVPPDWKADHSVSASIPLPPPAPENDHWVIVPLRLKLLSPLVASDRTVGNVIETLDYLPGTSLLPHICRVINQFFPPLEPIRRGELCVLNATLEVDQKRSWPVPKTWAEPKTVMGENLVLVNRMEEANSHEQQFKPVRGGYVNPQAQPQTVRVVKVVTMSRTHNTVCDEVQRPTEDVGGVYTYEAIASGCEAAPVYLRSELRVRQSLVKDLPPGWQKKLQGRISLGRSSRDDYGFVELHVGEPSSISSPKSPEPKSPPFLYVWLLSDCLLRNERLQYDSSIDALVRELERRLECKLEYSCDSAIISAVSRTSRRESWHGKWKLPRPSLVGIQAGSCFVFKVVSGQIDPHRLAELEMGGVGHRTAEGYGQVSFNHPFVAEALSQQPKAESANADTIEIVPEVSPISSNDPVSPFARRIERDCWKQEIRRACLEFANSAQNRKNELGWEAKGEQGKPPMSQLGGLRGQLGMLRRVNDRPQVISWLDHLADNKRRKDKWPSIDKVKALIESDTRIWDIIKTDGWPTLTENAHAELRQELWALAVRMFFDACIRAHKRELEVGRGA